MGFENFQPSHWYFSSDIKGHSLVITLVLLAVWTILFLVVFLIRHVCMAGSNSPAIAPATVMIAQHTIAIPPSLGLDATIINSLPMFIHRSSDCSDDKDEDTTSNSFRGSECSICLGLYEDEEMVKVMPECLHAFHSDCVDEWLRSRSTCPLCRLSIDSSSSTGSATPC